MKVFVLIASIAACVLAAPSSGPYYAEPCDPEICKLPDCLCSSQSIPRGLPVDDTPQFVFLTFDDAVTQINYDYYTKAFDGKKNPDGCDITTTYFVSHEYTDYRRVHDLYVKGHEIALHSISHTPSTDYWKNLDVDTLRDEFGGERETIGKFANINKDDIKGVRLPLLQLSGDNSFEAIRSEGITYDCSWPTRNYFWPYTLDYASTQDCPLGPCPTESHPGTWVVPMIMLKDDLDVPCSMVDACTNIEDDVDSIFEFLKRNFERVHETRAPFGIYMHAAWFGQKENALKAYIQFVDYLINLDNVYIVNISKGLEWMRDPKKISDLPSKFSCAPSRKFDCGNTNFCELKKGEEIRWMQSCSTCPKVYPWLGNALGQ